MPDRLRIVLTIALLVAVLGYVVFAVVEYYLTLTACEAAGGRYLRSLITFGCYRVEEIDVGG